MPAGHLRTSVGGEALRAPGADARQQFFDVWSLRAVRCGCNTQVHWCLLTVQPPATLAHLPFTRDSCSCSQVMGGWRLQA